MTPKAFRGAKGALFAALFLIVLILLQAGRARCQEKSMNELMNLSLEELAEVVVTTPAKTSQKLKEIPGTVRVISARDISARGYLTLEDALSDLPGMQFRNIIGFNSYVFMRGVPNQNNLILVMIDGVQVNELNSGGFYGGGQYNLSNVEQIEVVYGPASAMYGTNAVSGVINIITKSAKNNKGVRLSTMAGGFDTRQHDLVYGFYDENNDVDLNMSAMFKKSGKADLRGAQGDGNWSDTLENFEDDSAFDAKLRNKRFTFGLNYQDKQASYVTKDRTSGTLFQDFGTNWHIRFLNAYAKYDYQKSDRWSWHSMLYYRNATVEDDTKPLISLASAGDPGYQERWYRPNHLAGLENRLNCELGPRLSLIIGTVSERESLSAAFSKTRSVGQFVAAQEPPEPQMLTDDLSSVYAQLQWRIKSPLSFTAGLRRDDSGVYGKVVTPRLGLVYDKNKFNAKLLYAEAYRAPKAWDYQDGLGNPDLSPEAMKSMELAFGYSFTDHVRGGLSAYSNALSNGLTRENIGAGWRWTNVGRIETTGFEGELEYKKDRWRSYINYTYTDSATADGAEVPEISRHSANAGVQYCFTDRLKLDVRGQYLGKRKNTQPAAAANDPGVAGAFVLHGTLSLANYRGYDFQLAARNIFDKEYYHTSNTSVSMYRQPQSLVTLKVSRQF